MDIKAEKQSLINWINQIEDLELIEKLKNIIYPLQQSYDSKFVNKILTAYQDAKSGNVSEVDMDNLDTFLGLDE